MKEQKTGNNKYLREMNQSIILDLIRNNEGMSRKALADKTGLSATASGAIVKALLSDEFIQETGAGESSGGRKPVILELMPDSYFAFGFDIDVKFIYTVVLDITGRIVYKNKRVNSGHFTPEEAVRWIGEAFDGALKKLGIATERILGAGISIPGMVNIHSRRIMLAPNLGWSDTDILTPLARRLGVAVYLDNEAMCSALCENWLGQCQGVDDFICINVDTGIGAGLFIRGKMYRGFSGTAGEVGHISVNESGPRCKCGNRGCLETIASVNAMVAMDKNPGSKANEDLMLYSNDFFETEEDFIRFLEKARGGETSSLDILRLSAFSMGKAIATLINTFNPQKIVLGKKFPQFADLVIRDIRKTADTMALAYPAGQTDIVASSFGEDSSALGAAIIPVRKLFGR